MNTPPRYSPWTSNDKEIGRGDWEVKGFDVAQTSFATKLSHRLIEEHRALIAEYRTQYANLPDGGSSQLESLLKKLDQPTHKKQSPATP